MGDVFTISDIHSGKKIRVQLMLWLIHIEQLNILKKKLNITFDKIFVEVNDTESIDNAWGTSWKDNNKAYAKITFGIMSNKKQAQYSAYLDAVAHRIYSFYYKSKKHLGQKDIVKIVIILNGTL